MRALWIAGFIIIFAVYLALCVGHWLEQAAKRKREGR